MYLFLSFVVALISLYYLGVMADSISADTTYLTPLMGLLFYSIISIVRELRENPVSWLAGDYYDDDYGYRRDTQSYSNHYSSNNSTYNRRENANDWFDKYGSREVTEKTEYFVQDKKVERDDTQELVHYPSNSEVREKIKELNKSWWFRRKKALANIFAIDIEAKYVEIFKQPVKYKQNCKVKPIRKEDHTRYMPKEYPNSTLVIGSENKEYNDVVKFVGRSCEIAFGNIEQEIDENDE